MTRREKTVRLAEMGLLVAVSIILLIIRIPFPAAPFLEYDPADIPILIGGFAFGPIAGLMLTLVVCIIQGVTVSSASGIIGILMHFFATGSLVLVSSLIYKKNKTRKGAVIGLIFGVLAMTLTMALWNIIFTPIFMGLPREAVLAMILPVFVPFNLLKGGINALVTMLLYKSISRVFRKLEVK